MLIDCDSCAVRGLACADCVVTVLLGAPPAGGELDETERQAIDALADGGLVPPLRLVPVGAPDLGRGDDSPRHSNDDQKCSQHRAV